MEQTYPRFTPDMKKTHKILIPNMAPVQFRILAASMENHGYQVELLGNCGERVAELGLKYVHNDTCYPALLVIGQFLDALDSGKYDLDHTALIITQTGGGCRASNYIFLLRKALEKAGYGNIPVLSLNFSGLEKDSSMPMDLKFMRQALAAAAGDYSPPRRSGHSAPRPECPGWCRWLRKRRPPDRKSTRLNSSHSRKSRMPSSA